MNLFPLWFQGRHKSDFGTNLAAFNPQKPHTHNSVFMLLLCQLDIHGGAFWITFWLQREPNGANMSPKWTPRAPKSPPRAPKRVPKSLQSELQGASRSNFWSSGAAWAFLGAPSPQNITWKVPKLHQRDPDIYIKQRKETLTLRALGPGVLFCSVCVCLSSVAYWFLGPQDYVCLCLSVRCSVLLSRLMALSVWGLSLLDCCSCFALFGGFWVFLSFQRYWVRTCLVSRFVAFRPMTLILGAAASRSVSNLSRWGVVQSHETKRRRRIGGGCPFELGGSTPILKSEEQLTKTPLQTTLNNTCKFRCWFRRFST